jgi:hypothetical protein
MSNTNEFTTVEMKYHRNWEPNRRKGSLRETQGQGLVTQLRCEPQVHCSFPLSCSVLPVVQKYTCYFINFHKTHNGFLNP